jgi:hypothetical protein
MRFNEKEGRVRGSFSSLADARKPKGATGDNCPLRLRLPAAREGEGERRPVRKTNPFDKNRSRKDDATATGNGRMTGNETVEIM